MGIFKKADVSVVTEESAPKPRLAQIKRNLLSFISVSWVTPILRQGKTKPLEEQDLPELSDNDKTAASSRCLEPFWTKLKAHHANPNSVPLPCFRQHMAYIFILEFLLLFFLMGFNVFLDIIRPLLIPQVIRVILLGISPNNSTDGLITTSPYVMAFLFFGIQVLFTIVTFTTYALNLNMNIKMSSILIDAIYGKALRLSPKSRQEFSEGMINTLTTSDKTLIAQFPFGFISLIFNIVQIALALYYISRIFGYATWAAIGTYTLFTLSQLVVAPGLGAQFKAYMTNMDGLTKVLREFLYGIKIIKFQAIENAFHDKIEKLRATQLSGLRRLITMLMWLFTAVTIQQSLVPTTSIMAYAALGYPMTPEAIFGGLALFDALIIPSGSIVSHFTVVLQFGVSFKRVMSMLIAEEIQPHQQPQILSADASEDGSAVTLTKSSFTWEATKENKLEADSKKSKDKKDKKDKKSKSKDGKAKVVGSVGSGKSSFLAALNGSMRKTDGEASIYGRIAYCAQEPWIMSGTIEENILFSDESSYPNISKAVAASCLEHDLELLPHGLGTQIGEKGVNLSGGQKARVALARAIARDADIYLLDDPIAALDAHVGKKVFDNAICDTLKEKTVILVTHQLHLLPKVDLIVLLDDGCIIETGTFKDLMAVSDGGLATLMKDYSFDEAEEEDATPKLVANPC
ncbi:hypothetical protein BASA62_010517 [Batrachochytrium salamandrivorans]|nr:hypothetical protein BASA62_010517 [Batrachochytrium salamandrivorans]